MKTIEVKESFHVGDRVFKTKEDAKKDLQVEAKIQANHRVSNLIHKGGTKHCLSDIFDRLFLGDDIVPNLQAIREEYLKELDRIDRL